MENKIGLLSLRQRPMKEKIFLAGTGPRRTNSRIVCFTLAKMPPVGAEMTPPGQKGRDNRQHNRPGVDVAAG
jgi:hypothetical protein